MEGGGGGGGVVCLLSPTKHVTLFNCFTMYRIVTEGEVTTANSTRGR